MHSNRWRFLWSPREVRASPSRESSPYNKGFRFDLSPSAPSQDNVPNSSLNFLRTYSSSWFPGSSYSPMPFFPPMALPPSLLINIFVAYLCTHMSSLRSSESSTPVTPLFQPLAAACANKEVAARQVSCWAEGSAPGNYFLRRNVQCIFLLVSGGQIGRTIHRLRHELSFSGYSPIDPCSLCLFFGRSLSAVRSRAISSLHEHLAQAEHLLLPST